MAPHKGQGYSAHVTETCNNPGKPEIITDYEVHGAHRSDAGKAKDVVARLEANNKKPDEVYVDGGYPTVPSTYEVIENRGVELIGPVNRGPMDESVMGRDRFEFDDEGRVVKCPEGHPAIDHKILSNNSTAKTRHPLFPVVRRPYRAGLELVAASAGVPVKNGVQRLCCRVVRQYLVVYRRMPFGTFHHAPFIVEFNQDERCSGSRDEGFVFEDFFKHEGLPAAFEDRHNDRKGRW